jgi:hypothetical protein
MVDSPILRVIFAINAYANGPDSVFQFYTSFRDTVGYGQPCVDTSAPSWLGPRLVRQSDGTEFYFNSRKDTITIHTQAQQGESWVLVVDTAKRRFVGTVTQSAIATIDGVPDSFKTISIQAYVGNNPISHPYNNKVLQFSKAHGWLQTLDFFRFPNRIWGDQYGVAIDSTQHFRLPAAFREGRTTQDIDWKYKPGNEWIWKQESQISNNPDRKATHTTVRHDSVTAFQKIAPNMGLATIRTVEFINYHSFVFSSSSYIDSSATTVYTHTDTVQNIAQGPIPTTIENPWRSSVLYRNYAWKYDSVRYFVTQAGLSRGYYPRYQNGCMRLLPTLGAPDDFSSFSTYLTDFGSTAFYIQDVNDVYWREEYGRYIYIKTGTDHFGSKVDVSKLAVEAAHATPLFTIAPNPANEKIVVTTPGTQILQVQLMDISGRVIRQMSFQQRRLTVSTADIPDGLYLLEITGSGVRQTSKVLIQH